MLYCAYRSGGRLTEYCDILMGDLDGEGVLVLACVKAFQNVCGKLAVCVTHKYFVF